ncbi:MAG: hypothetical protein JWN52_3524 [Actinomycetia bacterium]|nr:hypothetical protein [Actinomycetes bacterium]
MPSVTRSVTGATAASMVSASMRGLSSESLAHSEAKPRVSARTAKSISLRGSVPSPHWAFPVGSSTPSRMSSSMSLIVLAASEQRQFPARNGHPKGMALGS